MTFVCLFFWLTSLCMTLSRSIHISTNDPISFCFYRWDSTVYMYHIAFNNTYFWTKALYPLGISSLLDAHSVPQTSSPPPLLPGLWLKLPTCFIGVLLHNFLIPMYILEGTVLHIPFVQGCETVWICSMFMIHLPPNLHLWQRNKLGISSKPGRTNLFEIIMS